MKFGTSVRKLVGGGALVILALTLVALSVPLYVYNAFNQEIPVAELEFEPVGAQSFEAMVRSGDFCASQRYLVLGEQWQLDASFLRWKGVAVLLGFQSMYRLDRLSGRYRDARDQNRKPTLVHDLRPEVWWDLFSLPEHAVFSGLMDHAFGSSVYMDIRPDLTYRVFRTEDALIVRTYPRYESVDGTRPLRLDITRACGNEPGVMARAALWLNGLLARLPG